MCAKRKIRPLSRKQLCDLYDVSPTTFNKWMDPFRDRFNLNTRRIFTIAEVKLLFKLIGSPLEEDEKEMVQKNSK